MDKPSQRSCSRKRHTERARVITHHFPCKSLVPEGGTFFQAEKSAPNWGSKGSCNPCSSSSRHKIPFIPEMKRKTISVQQSRGLEVLRFCKGRDHSHLQIYPQDKGVTAGRNAGHGREHHLFSESLQHHALSLEHQYRVKLWHYTTAQYMRNHPKLWGSSIT